MSQTWTDLAFLHWPIAPEALRRHVPAELDIDLFDGEAWIGLTPFSVSDSRLRGGLAVPGTRRFLEMNLRTYVRCDGRGGIFFFSLDAASSLAVLGARVAYRLPYRRAAMHMERRDGWITYESRRRGEPAELVARYRSIGEIFEPSPGSLEHFLTERYALFSVVAGGRVLEGDIHHAPWRLRRGQVEIGRQTVTSAHQLDVTGPPPHVLVAEPQPTLVWPPRLGRPPIDA